MIRFWGRSDAAYTQVFAFRIAHVGGHDWHATECLRILEDSNLGQRPSRVFDSSITITAETLKLTGVALDPADAAELATAWETAEGPHQARCHLPRHGLATFDGPRCNWFCAVCFECSNASLAGEAATQVRRSMLGDNAGSTTLLKVFQGKFDALIGSE